MSRNSSQPGAVAIGPKSRALVARFLREFGIIRRALVHPRVPWHAKAVAGCGLLYIVSPIQILPNFIPVIGQMDDVAVVILTLKYLRRFVSPTVLEECQRPSTKPQSSDEVADRIEPSTESGVITSRPGIQ